MVKAKGKSDRAAARAAIAGVAGGSRPPPVEPAPSAVAPLTAVTPLAAHDEAAEMPAPGTHHQSTGEDQTDAQSQGASAAGEATDPGAAAAASAQSAKDKEKEKSKMRLTLLKEKSTLVHGFMRSMVPILVDVYAASVAIQVRSRSLAGILKAISWLEPDELSVVLKVRSFKLLNCNSWVAHAVFLTQNVPIASLVGSVISSKDNPSLVIGALQAVEILLAKLPQQYRRAFRREGVLHEIEIRASQDLTIKSVPKSSSTNTPAEPSTTSAMESISVPSTSAAGDSSAPVVPPTGEEAAAEDGVASPPEAASPAANPLSDGLPPPSILSAMLPPPVKRSSSTPVDPQDAIVLRCRVIKFKHLSTPVPNQADDPFESMLALGRRLAHAQATEVGIRRTLGEIAALFSTQGNGNDALSQSISSFELIKSGLVDEMLEFATSEGRKGKRIKRHD